MVELYNERYLFVNLNPTYWCDFREHECSPPTYLIFVVLFYEAHKFIWGRKEMVYLTTHSTHFIYGYMASASFGDED